MSHHFLKQLTCPICHDILFISVLTSDGTPIHESCAKQYFASTKHPKSLTTNEPLASTTLTPNTFINREFENIITGSTDFDNDILELSIEQIHAIGLSKLIINTKRLHNKIDTNILNQLIQSKTNIFEMITEEKEYTIINLLKHNLINIHQTNSTNNTLLIHACMYKLSKLALYLITTPININHINNNNNTALIWAIYEKLPDVATSLISHGANINHIDPTDNTPLTWACKKNMTDIALKLLDDPTIKLTTKSHSSLYYACYNNMIYIATKLLTYPTIDINFTNKYNRTPLIIACKNKHTEIALLLLRMSKIIIDHKDNDGNYAITYACEENLIEVIYEFSKLFASNPNPNLQSTILNWACSSPPFYPDLAINILSIITPQQSLQQLKLPLQHACSNNLPTIVEAFIKYHPNSVNTKIKHDNTLLNWACKHSHSSIALTLIPHTNTNIDKTNDDNDTPLILACKNELNTVALLILKYSTFTTKIQKQNKLTAFIHAHNNKLTDVTTEILDSITAFDSFPELHIYNSLTSNTHKQIFFKMCLDSYITYNDDNDEHNHMWIYKNEFGYDDDEI